MVTGIPQQEIMLLKETDFVHGPPHICRVQHIGISVLCKSLIKLCPLSTDRAILILAFSFINMLSAPQNVAIVIIGGDDNILVIEL